MSRLDEHIKEIREAISVATEDSTLSRAEYRELLETIQDDCKVSLSALDDDDAADLAALDEGDEWPETDTV